MHIVNKYIFLFLTSFGLMHFYVDFSQSINDPLPPSSTWLGVGNLLEAECSLKIQTHPMVTKITRIVEEQFIRSIQFPLADTLQEQFNKTRQQPPQKFNCESILSQKNIAETSNALLEKHDVYSKVLTPDEWTHLLESNQGRLSGVGLSIDASGEFPKVSKIHPDSPAAKAPIAIGDWILKINNKPMFGSAKKDISEILKLSSDGFEIESFNPRSKAVKKFHLDKAAMQQSSVEAIIEETPAIEEEESSFYLYLKVSQFDESVVNHIESAYSRFTKEISHEKRSGLVLDLRGNPGGLFSRAIDLVDLFVDHGSLLSTSLRSFSQSHDATISRQDILDEPLVVLIDDGSASASEIVAGALKERDRALLIGSSSFGKNTIQNLYELPNTWGIKLTIGSFGTSFKSLISPQIHPHFYFEPINFKNSVRKGNLHKDLFSARKRGKTSNTLQNIDSVYVGFMQQESPEELKTIAAKALHFANQSKSSSAMRQLFFAKQHLKEYLKQKDNDLKDALRSQGVLLNTANGSSALLSAERRSNDLEILSVEKKNQEWLIKIVNHSSTALQNVSFLAVEKNKTSTDYYLGEIDPGVRIVTLSDPQLTSLSELEVVQHIPYARPLATYNIEDVENASQQDHLLEMNLIWKDGLYLEILNPQPYALDNVSIRLVDIEGRLSLKSREPLGIAALKSNQKALLPLEMIEDHPSFHPLRLGGIVETKGTLSKKHYWLESEWGH